MKRFILCIFLAAIASASGCAMCDTWYPQGPVIGAPECGHGSGDLRAGSVLSGPYMPGRLVSP
jgi:hypothetical protein